MDPAQRDRADKNFLRGAATSTGIQGAGPPWRTFVPTADEVARADRARHTLNAEWDKEGR